MEADLLVVNYGTKSLLRELLINLNRDYEPGVWNLYVQDNASQDNSADFLQRNAEKYNITRVIASSENVGYAKAINRLASKSSSDLLVAVNSDTWFTTRHVKQMIKSFEDNPNQAICGPKQMDSRYRIRHGGILWDGVRGINPIHRGWSEFDPRDTLYKDRVKCWTVSGSMYYIRRSVWDEMTSSDVYQKVSEGAEGAFLPTPHFFEETFCSQHAQHLGYEVWYDGTVETIGHHWHASSDVGEASRLHWATSKDMYVKACDALGITHEC